MDDDTIGGTIASGGLKSKLLLAAAAVVGLVLVLKLFVEKKAGQASPMTTPDAANATGHSPTRDSNITLTILAPGAIPTANDGTPGHTSSGQDPRTGIIHDPNTGGTEGDAGPGPNHRIPVDLTPFQRLMGSLHGPGGAYYTPHGETIAQVAQEFHISDPAALTYNSHNSQYHWNPGSVPTSDIWIARSAIAN